MRNRRPGFIAFLLCFTFFFVPNLFATNAGPNARSVEFWQGTRDHALKFFDEHGWRPADASTVTSLDNAGKIVLKDGVPDETRWLVATGRMASAYANGTKVQCDRAVAQATLLLRMVRGTEDGIYLAAAVKPDGTDTASAPQEIVASEQAYGIGGLAAVHRGSQNQNAWSDAKRLYAAFHKRFYDKTNGGFFDRIGADGKVVKRKTFASTVYVATAMLFPMIEANAEGRAERTETLFELMDQVATNFVDSTTGYLFEGFNANWSKPYWDPAWQIQENDTIGIVGHNFQAAWALLRASELAKNTPRYKTYRAKAAEILTSMIDKGIDSKNGGVFDSMLREQNKPMRWGGNNPTKAWWQQLFAMMALDFARELKVMDIVTLDKAFDKVFTFYVAKFIDYKNGGEFAVVTQEGVGVTTELKGSPGKAAWHAVETAVWFTEALARQSKLK